MKRKSVVTSVALVASIGVALTVWLQNRGPVTDDAMTSVAPPITVNSSASDQVETPARVEAAASDRIEESTPRDCQITVCETNGDVIWRDQGLVDRSLVARNCRDETWQAYTDQGLVSGVARECDQVIEHDHAFTNMTDDQLRTLAKYDGAAAMILADRLHYMPDQDSDPTNASKRQHEIRQLRIQSFAVSNNQQAFDVLFDQLAGGGTVTKNGVIDTDYLAKNYVWSSIGERVGHVDPSDVAEYRAALVDAGVELSALDTRIEDWFSRLDKTHRDITGEGLL